MKPIGDKPITGFGDVDGKLLFVGLAPAAHGGTRTGQSFLQEIDHQIFYINAYTVLKFQINRIRIV